MDQKVGGGVQMGAVSDGSAVAEVSTGGTGRRPTSDGSARRPIRVLEDAVISRIAAGEVVERPASAVKELLENALDAGARSITVEVEEGGRDLIRVTDDGAGIPRAELPLAVAAHATSKIDSADDLFRLFTLGFRGEALNSIAGVSDFSIRSRPASQPTGALIEVRHGMIHPVRDCGCPAGTQVEVRNLFASVPARRKFLKSRQTEIGHITETMVRVAMTAPGIGLKLVHNGRAVFDRPADADLARTIESAFGKEIGDGLIRLDETHGGYRLSGFVCHPSIDRPNNRLQYLFVNGRAIRDRSLSHAIGEAYRGLIMTQRYPVVFLFVEVPGDEVDVNVHPTKAEVRFQDPHRIYSLLLSSIRTRFLASDLTAGLKLKPYAGPTPAGSPGLDALGLDSSADASRGPKFDLRAEPAQRSPGLFETPAPSSSAPAAIPSTAGGAPGRRDATAERATDGGIAPRGVDPFDPFGNRVGRAEGELAGGTPFPMNRSAIGPARPIDRFDEDRRRIDRGFGLGSAPALDRAPAGLSEGERRALNLEPPRSASTPSGAGVMTKPPPSPSPGIGSATTSEPARLTETIRALQLHHTYLVVETAEGMLLIDQHALHERVLYEEFRRRAAAGGVEVQELLVPEPVELTPAQTGLVLEAAPILAEVGLKVEEFGARCVLVQSVPVRLARVNLEDLLRTIAGKLEETGRVPSRDILFEDLLNMCACKAAVKAGDPLTEAEIEDLVRLRHLVEDSHHCPHGRPTVLKFSLRDLEKHFRRV
jgi:DNA mismatch repair protein MutL